MYQLISRPCRFAFGLYPVVDSVEWIERLLQAGVRTIQLRIKDKRDEESKPTLWPPLNWVVAITPACLSTTTASGN